MIKTINILLVATFRMAIYRHQRRQRADKEPQCTREKLSAPELG
jgi:hypothetical protein